MEDKWNEIVTTVTRLMESKDLYQKSLGELADMVDTEYGWKKLKQLPEDVKNQGVKCSFRSLLLYMRVFRTLKPIINRIPKDFNYNAWRNLALSGEAEKWLNKALENGWSSSMLNREMKIAQGKTSNKICPICGAVL